MEELQDLLMRTPFEWPSFCEWDSKFKDMGYEPIRWATPEALNPDNQWFAMLQHIEKVSYRELGRFLKAPYPVTRGNFMERFDRETLEELWSRKAICFVDNTMEKLHYLPRAFLINFSRTA